MSLSRSKRTSKPIDYSAFETEISDDDFDYAPAIKKKVNTNDLKKKSKNEDKLAVQLNKENSLININSLNSGANGRGRKAVGEQKFEDDIEKALELSTRCFKEFEGFSTENKTNERETKSISGIKGSLLTVDVHRTHIKETDKVVDNGDAAAKEAQQVSPTQPTPALENDQHPTVTHKASKRQRKKKVNFAKDSESDSDEEGEEKAFSRESDDDFDFFTCSKKRKIVHLSSTDVEEVSMHQNSPKKMDDQKSSFESKRASSPKASATQSLKKSLSPDLATTQSAFSLSESSDSAKGFQTSTKATPDCLTVPGEPKPKLPLAKFQSSLPSLSPSPSPSSCTDVPAKIGLRLGLSRKATIKTLHPNAFAKLGSL